MKAKDTVMSDTKIGDLLDLESEYQYPCSDGSELSTVDCRPVAKAQAEISFKAGQREMVNYLSNGSLCEHKIAKRRCARCWHKKLVELGLEDE